MLCQQCHPSMALGDADIWRRNASRIHTFHLFISEFCLYLHFGEWETNPSTKTSKLMFQIVMPTLGKSCHRPWLHSPQNQRPKLLHWIFKQIFQDGCRPTSMQALSLGGKHTQEFGSSCKRKYVEYFIIKFAKYIMLKASCLWFVIFFKIYTCI